MTTVEQAEESRTQAQAEASRLNGAKSRGPATAEGRERSRWNALRHGLAAEKVVVPGEEAEEFDAYREAFFDDQRPAGALEVSLVERIAVISWRLRRAVEMEGGLIAADQWDAHKRQCEMDRRLPGREGKDWSPPSPIALGRVLWRSMSGPNCPYDTVGRYERRLERGYFQSIRELRQLKKDRERGMGNGEQDAGTSGRGPGAPALRCPQGEAGSAPPADGGFGDASMYGMSAPVGADPFADPDAGHAPPGKWKMRSWHYGPEYPGGCLVEERWVDKTKKKEGERAAGNGELGEERGDAGKGDAETEERTQPATFSAIQTEASALSPDAAANGAENAAENGDCTPASFAGGLYPVSADCGMSPVAPTRDPQLNVPPAEVVAEGMLADEAATPAAEAAAPAPEASPAQAQTNGGQNA